MDPVDIGNGEQFLLKLLGDESFDFLCGSTGPDRRDGGLVEIDVRKELHGNPGVGRQPAEQTDKEQNIDQDVLLDAKARKTPQDPGAPAGTAIARSRTLTRSPDRNSCTRETATRSPG